MMFIFAFRLKLLFLREKIHHVFVLNTLIMPFPGIKGKKADSQQKKKNPNSFLAVNMTQIVKSNIFTLEMFRSIDILSTQLSACL